MSVLFEGRRRRRRRKRGRKDSTIQEFVIGYLALHIEVSKYFIVTVVMKLEPALATPSFVLTCNEMMEGPTAPYTDVSSRLCNRTGSVKPERLHHGVGRW